MFHLHELGWSVFFQEHVPPDSDYIPARVIEEQRSAYRVACAAGELHAELSGKLRHQAARRADLPAVGDWVLMDARGVIHRVLPRKSRFSRKAAGLETAEQIIAANIDTVFLVTSFNADLNPRRLARYLTMIWDSGAQPVILLNKADLCGDAAAAAQAAHAAEEVSTGVPVHAISASTGEGCEHIEPYLKPGQTGALLGSSGVGKSTLINRLLGREAQPTGAIREADERGRHITTSRRLFILPAGGMLIDTPGMRELQLWESAGLSQVFDDIEALAEECRFRDCQHVSEPGCAVRRAVEDNRLGADRFESYLKLRREAGYIARKQDVFARIEETRRWKQSHKAARRQYKSRDKP